MKKLGSVKRRTASDKKLVKGQAVVRNAGIVSIRPCVVERGLKQRPKIDPVNLPKIASLDQVKTMIREMEREDSRDMEIGLAEVSWQWSGAEAIKVFARELDTSVASLPDHDEGDEDTNVFDDDRRDEPDVEEQAQMENGEQSTMLPPDKTFSE